MTEEYGADERQLNEFLKLHPMLSLESTSTRTLQLVQAFWSRRSLRRQRLRWCQSYDDTMLRPCSVSLASGRLQARRACAR